LLWVIRLSVQGVAFFSSRAPLNVANIEKITREWLIDFGAGVRRVEAPDCEFAYEVTLESGRHVSVSRRKRTPNNVLSIQAALKLSDDDQRRYEALQPVDAEGVLSQARLEIARSRLGYEVNRARPVTFALRQDVPLTPDLTQFQLIDAINDVDLAVVAVRETLLSALQLRPQGGANR
jgi:hypothetical protein